MKSLLKKPMLLCSLLLLTMSVPVMAQTKSFGFTLVLNQSVTGAAAVKAGGSSFEKKYYLRQTTITHPQNATRYFSYHPSVNGRKVANGLSLSENDTKSHNNTYLSGEAKAGKTYKLYCKCTGNKRKDSKSTVSGRWTP